MIQRTLAIVGILPSLLFGGAAAADELKMTEPSSNAAPVHPPPPRPMKSAPMVGVGTFLSTVGIAGLVGGVATVEYARNCDEFLCGLSGYGGGLLVFVGAAHLIPGVTLIAVGSQPRPDDQEPAPRASFGVQGTKGVFQLTF